MMITMFPLISRWVIDVIIWCLATISGFLIYPILPKDKSVKLARGQEIFKWKWADGIWGNELDG
ncbi:hypothetical protein D6779_00975, partial [Candidatus Parcubacteria bacterium]